MCTLTITQHADCKCVLSRSTSPCSVATDLAGANNWLGRNCTDYKCRRIIDPSIAKKCKQHSESQEEMSRSGRSSLERKISAGEARHGLGSSRMGLNTERKISQGEAGFGLGSSMMGLNTERKVSQVEAGFGLGLADGHKQLKHFKKRSVAVPAGKVKEMVEKFNGAAILEEAAAEIDTLKMKRGPSQEHTPTKNTESDGSSEVTTTEIDQLKDQDGIAEDINKLPSPEEPKNVNQYHLNARNIRHSLRSKDDETESVQSLTNSDFDEIFGCYDITQGSITKETDSSAVSNATRDQHKLIIDFAEYEENISGFGIPADEERGPNWVSPIYKWFASKCDPPETYRGKSTLISTNDSPSVTQDATFETHSTSLQRRNVTSICSSNPPTRAVQVDSLHDNIQTPDASVLAREYSDLMPHFIYFDENFLGKTEDLSLHSSSGFPKSQQLITNHNPPRLDSSSTNSFLPRIPIETKPSHSYTSSNTSSIYTSSIYSTEDVSLDRNSDVFFDDPPTLNSNNSTHSNFPPLRHHGRHQITEFVAQPRLSSPEPSHFSFNVGSDFLSPPACLSPANEHSVRPQSAISNLSGASTIVAQDSTLVDLPSFADLLIPDAETGENVVPDGKSLTEQRVDVYGTV